MTTGLGAAAAVDEWTLAAFVDLADKSGIRRSVLAQFREQLIGSITADGDQQATRGLWVEQQRALGALRTSLERN